MKIIFLVSILGLVSTAAFAQDGSAVLCKNLPVPEGFIISGETLSDSCNGSAWLIKPALHRLVVTLLSGLAV